MTKIAYRFGDVLGEMDKARILVHVVNNKGGFGKGFALNLARKYPRVKEAYRAWLVGEKHRDYPQAVFRLGNIQSVTVHDSLTVINMLAQNGYKSAENPCPLDTQALARCLSKVKEVAIAERRIVVMPKIGTGLAGGDWQTIEKLVGENLCKAGIKVVCFEWS